MKSSIHGMTSEQAKNVKSFGHKNENIVAINQNAKIIGGNGKGDIITYDKKVGSVKTGKKTQWGLYCLETLLNNDWTTDQRKSLLNYVNFLPDSKDEYFNNREKYKVNIYASQVLTSFGDKPMDLIKFFCGFGKIDFFHLTDIRTGNHYKIDSDKFFDMIKNAISKTYITKGGKFVIKGGPKNTILFELEMRKGTNHKKILFHSLLSRIIDIVKD